MKDGARADWPALEVYIKTGQFSQKYSLVQISSEKPWTLSYAGGTAIFSGFTSYEWSVFGRFCQEGSKSRWLGDCPADGITAGEEFTSGELEKWCEPKHLLCLPGRGRPCASAASDCFWARDWRFSVPRASDLFMWCQEWVQVSALPWQICSLPKGEYNIKIRGLK